jgi:hypothetical protein
MTSEEEWWSDFKGVEFSELATEFQYTKIAREIDQVDDVKVLREMMKQYVKIHLKEKEMWKKLLTGQVPPINTEE